MIDKIIKQEEIKKSQCCNDLILTVPKYKLYTMNNNNLVNICNNCKKRIK
jgi:hypothetical protein